jgi:two-component system, OmpR family, sensor histidine kinase BaeS
MKPDGFHFQWGRWRRPEHFRPHWENKRRFLFLRLARFLAMAGLLFLIGMGGLAFLLTRLFGGGGSVTLLVWLSGCGLAIIFPLLAAFTLARSMRGFFNPVARVMAAADAVAEGDLTARVPEEGRGEFRNLAVSFNHMVERLERSDQLRRSLTADVAHELRTPLHIIQGNLEGIQDGVYQPDAAQIDLLLDETRQLSRLVEDLRTLSLAESGQLALKKESLDATELLEDVATSFSGPASTAGVTLEVRPRATQLSFPGDAGRLDQVLSNLVANALRHTPPGGKITLSAEAAAGRILFRVADNGSGIPPAYLPNIFDRFWHADSNQVNPSYTGSGLGLAIARQLVEAHGGHISVESQLEQGTTFTIDLPGIAEHGPD